MAYNVRTIREKDMKELINWNKIGWRILKCVGSKTGGQAGES